MHWKRIVGIGLVAIAAGVTLKPLTRSGVTGEVSSLRPTAVQRARLHRVR